MSKLYTPLKQQEMMVQHVLSHPISALFCGCGLGKTSGMLETAAHLLSDGQIKGVLIIAPKRVCTMTWPAELEKWSNFKWLRMVSMRTEEGQKAWDEGTADIYVINFEMLGSHDIIRNCPDCSPVKCKCVKDKKAAPGCKVCLGDGKAINPKIVPNSICEKCKGSKKVKYRKTGFSESCLQGRRVLPVDMLLVDELTFAKSHDSKGIKSLLPYRPAFKRVVGMTGTPVSESYMGLFAMYRLLDGGERFGTSITAFRDRYFDSDFMGYSWELKDWAAEAIQKKIADITLTLTSEDYLDIPTTVFGDIEIELTPPVRKQYKVLERDLLLTLKDNEIVAKNSAALSTKLLQFLGGACYDEDREVAVIHDLKIVALKKLIAKVKRPMLLAVNYLHEKDRLLAEIPGSELFHEDRLGAWDRGEIPVWIIHPKSGGHGLNLQVGGDVLVWFTLCHSRDFYDQLRHRIVRTGQENVTTIYRLLIKDSYDEAVVEALRRKGDQQGGLLSALKNLQRLAAAR